MFGEKLRELRKNKNLSQEELGKICGVAKNTISYWEKNLTQPSFEIVKEIAKYFNVSADYLLGIDLDKLEKLKVALKEAGLFNGEDDMTMEDFERAMKIAIMLKEQKNNE